MGFNSIVVRLKVALNKKDKNFDQMFQFHSGSIKSRAQPRHWWRFERFQFHSGSIKSDTSEDSTSPFHGFNSIVVRLKAPPQLWSVTQRPRFNSIVVRLKGGFFPRKTHNGPCFNSIVVRLKGASTALADRVTGEFQFHSGSIKRGLAGASTWGRWPFQFHSGSIKSCEGYEGNERVKRVSIP